jgi:dCMP deaminase
MIIGLTGKNGSGKGEVAEFLEARGFHYHSLSDELREEMEREGLEVTRENLIPFANKVRNERGPSYLAEQILKRLDPDKYYVVDSIRNPFEVEALRKRKDFHLVSVVANPKVRFGRLKERSRENDPTDYEQFLEIDAAEASNQDPAAQQLDMTDELADAKVENNGTLDELHDKIKEILRVLAMNTKRPSWDEYFMGIAQVVSLRGNCLKRKVAAIVVKDKRVITTGYNGTPRKITNCNEGGCARCSELSESGKNLHECICSHAEENAIVQAAYHGVSVKDSTIYTTFSPCLICTKLIINSGIKEVIYNKAYSIDKIPLKLLKEAGVKVKQFKFGNTIS